MSKYFSRHSKGRGKDVWKLSKSQPWILLVPSFLGLTFVAVGIFIIVSLAAYLGGIIFILCGLLVTIPFCVMFAVRCRENKYAKEEKREREEWLRQKNMK